MTSVPRIAPNSKQSPQKTAKISQSTTPLLPNRAPSSHQSTTSAPAVKKLPPGYGVPRTSVSTFPTSSIRAPTLLVARANFQPLNRLPSINRLRPPPAYYPLSITYPPAITARAPPQEVVKTLPPVVRLPRQTFAQLNATRNPYVEPPRVALPQRTFAQIQVNPIADSPLPPKTFAQSLGVRTPLKRTSSTPRPHASSPYYAFPPDAFPPAASLALSMSQSKSHPYRTPPATLPRPRYRQNQSSTSDPLSPTPKHRRRSTSEPLGRFRIVRPLSPPHSEVAMEGSTRKDVAPGCSGCGTCTVPSFVALIPCDHLLCRSCMTILVSSASEAASTGLECFQCGTFVQSFGPAFETRLRTGIEGDGSIKAGRT